MNETTKKTTCKRTCGVGESAGEHSTADAVCGDDVLLLGINEMSGEN